MSAFTPGDWTERLRRNAEVAESNAMMDSGWSLTVAQSCEREFARLANELIQELRAVPILPADFFDRPGLAAVLAAVHEAFGAKGGGA